MTYYISGPITGQPNKNAVAFFDTKLRLEHKGFTVVNPLEFEIEKDLPVMDGYDDNYILALRKSIEELSKCDGVVLLQGWEISRGARLEVTVALGLNMPIRYLNEENELLDLIINPVIQLVPLIPSCYWNA